MFVVGTSRVPEAIKYGARGHFLQFVESQIMVKALTAHARDGRCGAFDPRSSDSERAGCTPVDGYRDQNRDRNRDW